MKATLEINCNDTVEVELTDAGLKTLGDTEFGLGMIADKMEGRVLKEQLHVIMNIFGPRMFCGAGVPFKNNNIRIVID